MVTNIVLQNDEEILFSKARQRMDSGKFELQPTQSCATATPLTPIPGVSEKMGYVQSGLRRQYTLAAGLCKQ